MSEFNESLIKRIKVLNETVWERKVFEDKLNKWLDNFDEGEKSIALYLLSEFMYFNEIQIEVLLKSVYRDLFRYPLIENIRKQNSNIFDSNIIEKNFVNISNNTRFKGIGNAAESGSSLLYNFRTINNIPVKLFGNYDNKNINKIVYIDDFSGSGNQILTNKLLKQEIEDFNDRNIQVDCFLLVATKQALSNINKSNLFNRIDSVINLDDSYKCFEVNSRYFVNSNLHFEMKVAKMM